MKYLTIFLVALVALSCGRRGRETSSVIFGDALTIKVPVKRLPSYNLNEFVDSVKFVNLETTDENLIRDINLIWFHDNKFIIADKGRGAFFIFDSDGRYLYRIMKKGRGPGEYIGITSAMFNPVSEYLIVYDVAIRKMLFYTLDGEFVKEIADFSNATVIRDVINLPNAHFLCYAYDFFVGYKGIEDRFVGLWEVDENGEYLRNLLTYEIQYPVYHNFTHRYFTLKQDGTVYLRDAIHSDLYEYRNDSLYKYIDYIIEDDRLPSQAGLSKREEKFTYSYESQIKKNYIITDWNGTDGTFYTVYDIARDEFIATDSLNYIGCGFPALRAFMVDTEREDVIVSQMNSIMLLYWTKEIVSSLPPATRAFWEQVVEGKTENEIMDMNPILQIMYLKRQR